MIQSVGQFMRRLQPLLRHDPSPLQLHGRSLDPNYITLPLILSRCLVEDILLAIHSQDTILERALPVEVVSKQTRNSEGGECQTTCS
jgi:hypothetical protein